MSSRGKSLVNTVFKFTDKSCSDSNESDIDLDYSKRLAELVKSAEKNPEEKIDEAINNIEMSPDVQVNDREFASLNNQLKN